MNPDFINSLAQYYKGDGNAAISGMGDVKEDIDNLCDDLDYLDDDPLIVLDENTAVSEETFEKVMNKATDCKVEEETSKMLYDILDVNNDGVLSKDELSVIADGQKFISSASMWFSLLGTFDTESVVNASEKFGTIDFSDTTKDYTGALAAMKDIFGEDSEEYKTAEAGKEVIFEKQTLKNTDIERISRLIKDGNANLSDYYGILTEASYEALKSAIEKNDETSETNETEATSGTDKVDNDDGDTTIDESEPTENNQSDDSNKNTGAEIVDMETSVWAADLPEGSQAEKYLDEIFEYLSVDGLDIATDPTTDLIFEVLDRAFSDDKVTPEQKIQILSAIEKKSPDMLNVLATSNSGMMYRESLNIQYAEAFSEIVDSVVSGESDYTIDDIIELETLYQQMTGQGNINSRVYQLLDPDSQNLFIDSVIELYKMAKSPEEVNKLNETFDVATVVQSLYSGEPEDEVLNQLFENMINANQIEISNVEKKSWENTYGEPSAKTFKKVLEAIKNGRFSSSEGAKKALMYACGGDVEKFCEYYHKLDDWKLVGTTEQEVYLPIIMDVFGGKLPENK